MLAVAAIRVKVKAADGCLGHNESTRTVTKIDPVARRNDFDSQEWQFLLAMPWIAGILIVPADPSWRVVGECKAMAAAVVANEPHGAASSMIKALLADMEGSTDPDEANDRKSKEELFGVLEQCGVLIAARCNADEA